MNSSLIEYGTSPSGHIVFSCGPHTGHIFVPIAFCRDADTAQLLGSAAELVAAARKALNFIENTESEMGEPLNSGDALRAAIAKATGAE